MEIHRFDANPIIERKMDDIGANVNGPSLIRAPEWIDDPLGEYYLYFAHHQGQYIRLAYADALDGNWRIYSPGTLHLAETGFDDHIASPDVHVDNRSKTIRMYYHGCCGRHVEDGETLQQYSRCALSSNGIDFISGEEILGRFYFRVFEWGGSHYALAKRNAGETQEESGIAVYRSGDGLTAFERGPTLRNDGARHTAVRLDDDRLRIFYSRIGDCPERILRSTVDLRNDWTAWEASAPVTVLEPTHSYEGANRALRPSESGSVSHAVRQVRDPAIFTEDGTSHLLYSVAGERGIAIAELVD